MQLIQITTETRVLYLMGWQKGVRTILEYHPVSGGGMVVKGGYGDGGLFNVKWILL